MATGLLGLIGAVRTYTGHMDNRYLEILLVAANLAIWLSPAMLALKRRAFSLIHPASVIPLLVSVSMMTALSERWFHWAGRGDFPGIRITTRLYYWDSEFFLLPLLVLAFAGIAFHFGVRLGCGRTVPGRQDRFHLDRRIPFVSRQYGVQLNPIAVLVGTICLMPFLLFGQGEGFFWATALVYAFNFLPALLYRQNARIGLVFLVLGLLVVGTRGSKGDFIYYFAPLIVFFQGTLYGGIRRFDTRKIVFAGLIALVMVAGTLKMFQQREVLTESDGGSGLASQIIVREYGFEVFAILVNESSVGGNLFGVSPYGSWFFQELKEAVPSALGAEKLRMGQEVAKSFMPFDYSYLPEAGFYRFFLFPFYYDLGVAGAVIGSFALGLLIGILYRLALRKSMRLGAVWPLFVYLPIPVYAEMVVNGAFSYALIHVAIASGAVWLTARLAMMNVLGIEHVYVREFR